jgi:hypothetical protein
LIEQYYLVECESFQTQLFFLFEQLKPGGEIPAKGKKITLHVQNAKDLTRDVIKVRRLSFYSIHFVELAHLCLRLMTVYERNIGSVSS